MRLRLTEHPGRATRVALVCALLSFAYLAAAWNAPIAPPVVGWIAPLASVVVGVYSTVRLVLATPLGPASRRFWRTMALAAVCIGVGAVSQMIDTLGRGAPTQVLSNRTSAFDLAGVVLMIAAILLVPVNKLTRAAWVTFALDAGTVLAGGVLFTWYFAIRNIGDFEATTGSSLPLVATVATGFLGVLVLLRISFAGVREVSPGALQLLAVAALTSCSAAGLSPQLAERPYLNTSFLAFPFAYGFLTAAVDRQRRAALAALDGDEPRRRPARVRSLYLLPYVAVLLTDGVLLATLDSPADAGPVIVGAVVLTALVSARQLVSFRENGRLLRRLDSTVADLRESENRMTHQATHDGLTGLANRALMASRLEAALAAREDIVFALIDLDDFKVVNDRLGHAVGDTLLVAAASRIQEAVGPDHTVARLGGDEFAVLLRGGSSPAAASGS
ncbi:GGDEF domain-containing protein, partial [Cryptosporangium phraense]